MSRKPHRLHLERLEDRQLMAGDLHAFVQNGTLFINEAAGKQGQIQNVQVAQLSSGKIQLTGLTSPVNPNITLINNGLDRVEFSGVNRIEANLGGGQDNVVFLGTDNVFRIRDVVVNTTSPTSLNNDDDIVVFKDFKVMNSVQVTTGAGRDTVRVLNTALNAGTSTSATFQINTGVGTATNNSDADVIDINGLTTNTAVSIRAGASDDFVTMRNTKVGSTVRHLLWFDLGAGADTLNVGSGLNDFSMVSGTGGLRVDAGTDAQNDVDRVFMKDVFMSQSIFVQLGAGNDLVEMFNIQSRKSIDLRGMLGNDKMTLLGVEAFDNFFAKMGEGSDTLDITFVKAQRVELDGGDGDGYDRLFLQQSPNIPTLLRTGFEEINGNKLAQKVTPELGLATR